MHDQSHGRLNGSAAAAFATICERNRNTGSILGERRRSWRRFVGQRYAQRSANPSRAIAKLFYDEHRGTGGVNERFVAANLLEWHGYSLDHSDWNRTQNNLHGACSRERSEVTKAAGLGSICGTRIGRLTRTSGLRSVEHRPAFALFGDCRGRWPQRKSTGGAGLHALKPLTAT